MDIYMVYCKKQADTSGFIAIVGAGLAGLTAAYQLQLAGIKSIIYEASHRLGGRVYSGQFPNGQVYERAGEFIDETHYELLALALKFNLSMEDLTALGSKEDLKTNVIEYPDTLTTTNIQTKIVTYTTQEAAVDYFNTINQDTCQSIYQQVVNDFLTTYPTNLTRYRTPWPLIHKDQMITQKIDDISLDEYINRITACLRKDGIGSKTKLAQLFKTCFTVQFGSECKYQSPFNFIHLMGKQREPLDYAAGKVPVALFELFGSQNERYRINGGNSRLIEKLSSSLEKSNNYNVIKSCRLTTLRHCSEYSSFDQHGNKPYELTFQMADSSLINRIHQHVILTIPFASIRPSNNIDISNASFSKLKLHAIQNLPMGKNVKSTYQLKKAHWNNPVIQALKINSDFQLVYEGDYSDMFETKTIVSLSGGDANDNLKKNLVINHSDVIHEQVSDNWKDSIWQHGSYSFWGTGQYTGTPNSGDHHAFIGYEGVPEPYNTKQTGNCHFAGEHTSFQYPGLMNGAVESGQRVAIEIIRSLDNR